VVTSASLQSSKYRPETPWTNGDAASRTDVVAPCSTLFQGKASKVAWTSGVIASSW
jgi:hypothetical protein